MAYYPDLSKCSGYRKKFYVGWLDEAHQFETARPAKWMIEKLWGYCSFSQLHRVGCQECPFPGCPGPFKKANWIYPYGRARTERELEEQDATVRELLRTRRLARRIGASKSQLQAGLDQLRERARRGSPKMT